MTMSGDNLKNLILQARSTAWQYKLEDYTDEALKTIGKTVRKAENDLFRELKHIDFRLPEGREHAVLSELNDLTFGIQAKLTGDIREAAAIAGQASIHEYGQILSFDGRLAETVGFNSVALSPAQLNAMVNVPIGGNLLNTWIQDSFKAHIVDGIHDEIKAGQLRGMSTDRIIKRLQDSFGMIKKDAESIARTSLSSINNAAAEKVYKENSDIVKTETWSASLEVGSSGRSTCLACAVNDGRVYPIDEPHIRPPLHIRCRCFMLPNTVSWRELGLDIDEMQKVARPYTERGANREILSGGQHKGGFESFLKGQSKKYQEDLLGPNRYRMWKDGKIKWENLADRDGNLILLKRGKDGGYDGLMPNRNKYVTPVDKPVKPVVKKEDNYKERFDKNLLRAEKRIYSRATEKVYVFDEKGNEVFSKIGGRNSVGFTLDEVKKMKGCILTHNHPSGSSFSEADILLLTKWDLKEVRAVSDKHRYSISLKDGVPLKEKALSEISKEYEIAKNTHYFTFDGKVANKELTSKEASIEYTHTILNDIAKNLKWVRYERKKWTPSQ
jgi:SPP1 gp7 family putative phage head morphogenesis protein